MTGGEGGAPTHRLSARLAVGALVAGFRPREYLCGCDQVGTLKVLTGDYGKPIKVCGYSSFGVPISDSFPQLFIPVGFAGGLLDRDTGLVRFGWRDYDPEVGRFTAPDPARDLRGDGDLYDYCVDDPVSHVDPMGLKFSHAAAVAGGESHRGISHPFGGPHGTSMGNAGGGSRPLSVSELRKLAGGGTMIPVSANATIPATRNGTMPATGNGTMPATQNGTMPATRNGTAAATQNATAPANRQQEERWTYNQRTGQLRRPDGTLVDERGYSGAPGHINNPASEHLRDRGPIPVGTWQFVGEPHYRRTTGDYSMELVPEDHDARGRTNFFIHGDSRTNPGAASRGCPIFSRRVREAINNSGVRRFDVTNEPEWRQ